MEVNLWSVPLSLVWSGFWGSQQPGTISYKFKKRLRPLGKVHESFIGGVLSTSFILQASIFARVFSICVDKLSGVLKIRVWLWAQWVAPNLAPLVNLVQGYVALGVKMLVFFFFFPYGFAFVVAIVMVIVALSIQTIDCMSKVVVCICMEVQNICVGFSCWWVNCKLWVLLVVWGIKFGCRLWGTQGPVGWKQNFGSYA